MGNPSLWQTRLHWHDFKLQTKNNISLRSMLSWPRGTEPGEHKVNTLNIRQGNTKASQTKTQWWLHWHQNQVNITYTTTRQLWMSSLFVLWTWQAFSVRPALVQVLHQCLHHRGNKSTFTCRCWENSILQQILQSLREATEECSYDPKVKPAISCSPYGTFSQTPHSLQILLKPDTVVWQYDVLDPYRNRISLLKSEILFVDPESANTWLCLKPPASTDNNSHLTLQSTAGLTLTRLVILSAMLSDFQTWRSLRVIVVVVVMNLIVQLNHVKMLNCLFKDLSLKSE